MAPRAFHVMAKPAGPECNLACRYCFYLEKAGLYPAAGRFRMSDAVLERFVRDYIESQDTPEIQFAWQGGEPTLLGVDFFRRVVELQRRFCPPGRKVANAFQTNGTLLDDEWGQFLKEHGFLVGISVDGPADMHDHWRVDRGGHPTHGKVMHGIAVLKRHGVEFNTLTVVHGHNAKRPREVYDFLRRHGSGFMQFIPLVERASGGEGLAPPPTLDSSAKAPVTRWSVDPGDYGEFLCAIFDEWVRRDVGKVFVQLFDVALGVWMNLPASLCVFGETCGAALVVEHNGDVYACDHYVYPDWKLGNLLATPLTALAGSTRQIAFGDAKRDGLPGQCRSCDVGFACRGECPKHRFTRSESGEPGLNYLCPAYRRFFRHADPYMKRMADWLKQGQPAARIMDDLARGRGARGSGPAVRE